MMTRQKTPALIVSCEHATNNVPERYIPLLAGCRDQLCTHKGYDTGALDFARQLAARLSSPLFTGSITRLLVDLNRSLTNHRAPPTGPRNSLPFILKEELLSPYYLPYHRQVEEL